MATNVYEFPSPRVIILVDIPFSPIYLFTQAIAQAPEVANLQRHLKIVQSIVSPHIPLPWGLW